MFFPLNRLIIALLLIFVTPLMVGCGDAPPATSTFETFAQHVRDGAYAGAWSMLTTESQKKLGNEANLKKVCENGDLAEVFKPAGGAHAEVKDSSFREDKRVCEGQIYLYDADGKKLGGSRGSWVVIDDSGVWKVVWNLTTSATPSNARAVGN